MKHIKPKEGRHQHQFDDLISCSVDKEGTAIKLLSRDSNPRAICQFPHHFSDQGRVVKDDHTKRFNWEVLQL